jgi:hypothetical protein
LTIRTSKDKIVAIRAIRTLNTLYARTLNALTALNALDSLDYYLEHVGLTQESGADFHHAQNRYCYYQKQNPHVIRSMVSMGVPESQITKFVQDILFPESL